MKTVAQSKFKGLNNTADPLGLGMSWLTCANNVDISESGSLSSIDGNETVARGRFSGAVQSKDNGRVYVIESGSIKRFMPDGSFETIAEGLARKPMHWAEINREIYFNNGVDAGLITEDGEARAMKFDAPPPPSLSAGSGRLPGGLYRVCCTFVLPDGRETGSGDVSEIELADGSAIMMSGIALANGAATQVYVAPANSTVFQLAFEATSETGWWSLPPEFLGAELRNFGFSCLPDGATLIDFFQGMLLAMQYLPETNESVVWMSQPLGFHLFDFADYITLPGRCVLMKSHPSGVLLGTDDELYEYDGETLKRLANFGAVPGSHVVADDDGILYFSTKRGPYAWPSLTALTPQVSFAPGLHACGALIQRDGGKKYVVSLRAGGEAFNARKK